MAMEPPPQQQHVLAVPLPAQGHLNPLVRFCNLLATDAGFIVTLVDFDEILRRLQQPNAAAHDHPPTTQHTPTHSAAAADADADAAAIANSPPRPGLIRRARISCAGLDLSGNFQVSSMSAAFATMTTIGPALEHLIVSLNCHGPPVTCLVSDFTITFPTQSVADKLGIPRIVVFTSSASRLLFTHYLSKGHPLSIQKVMEALNTTTKEKSDVFCKGLPGLATLLHNDIPHFKHTNNETQSVSEFMVESWKVCNSRAHALVVNSFEDLEASAFNTLAQCCDVPIYDVGFWVDPIPKECATSFWIEDRSCITWLDQQPNSSVLYISFGSITLLSKTQFEELLNGLISSQQRFLWVLRPGLVKNMDESSTIARIRSRSRDKGFITKWAPQFEVLAHPSVGGFLTHCGWNSISESIVAGVPMLCWPYFADQPLNARYIVNEWRVGLRFEHSKLEDNSLVEKGEIEKVIRALMEGEEGKLVRKNVKELKKRSHQCHLENGSSSMKFKALIHSLM